MATPIPRNEAEFRHAEVLAATRGTAVGPRWEMTRGVVTDSRAVQPGNLFVALRGERFDAHAFVAAAVESGATGLLVPAEDTDALAAALRQLIENPELGRKLGAAGRLRMQNEFSIDTMADKHVVLYESVVNG